MTLIKDGYFLFIIFLYKLLPHINCILFFDLIFETKKIKLKIQIKIQGEELRVDGKKRDDLQEAIAAIKTIDIGLPIEFINFRD